MKIQGFTIMEIMVGFVLTGIVITGAYFGIEIMMKTKYSIEQEQATIKNQAAIFSVVSFDFFEAKTIIGNRNHFIIDTKDQQIQYWLEDTMIVRETSKTDTLFRGEYEKNIVYLADNYIKELTVTIDTINYIYHKEYDLKKKIEIEY